MHNLIDQCSDALNNDGWLGQVPYGKAICNTGKIAHLLACEFLTTHISAKQVVVEHAVSCSSRSESDHTIESTGCLLRIAICPSKSMLLVAERCRSSLSLN